MSTPLLSLQGASKRFGPTVALDDASLELWPGEIHALMGENGAGKSTLIKLLAGLVHADAATLRVAGQQVRLDSAAAARQHGLRFIHQELSVIPWLSVAENLFMGKPFPQRGPLIDWPELHRRTRAILDELGLEHLGVRTKVARLGVGDRMLVQIACALQSGDGGRIYVMDEATAALSAAEAGRLFAVTRHLAGRGCAVLYVTHRLEEVFGLCDRVTVMRDGRTVATKAVEDATKGELIRLMTGRDVSEVFPKRDAPIGDAPVLEVCSLTSAFVREVSFTLREGEILGVAGLAGAGQHHLLRALMGADERLAGKVLLGGEALGAYPADAWARGLALVPEERRAQGLLMSRSVRDNITLPHLRQLSRLGMWLEHRREAQVSRSQAAAVRLKAAGPRQTVARLSGGNQQKVLFARATLRRPRVLLLCEPTRGVDVGAKHDIYRLMRDLSGQGVSTVVSSSDFAELLGLCDRLLVLQQGRQTALVTAAGLSPERLLGLCYGDAVLLEPGRAEA